jgi:WD40 repeat protein
MTRKPIIERIAELRDAHGPRLAFAPDGRRWAASDGRLLQIFDDATRVQQVPVPGGFADRLRFDSSGTRVLLAPHVWDVQGAAWRPPLRIAAPDESDTGEDGFFEPRRAAFSPDGDELLLALHYRASRRPGATGGSDAPAERLVSVRGTPLRDEMALLWEGSRVDAIRAVALDGRYAVAGGASLLVWDRATRRRIGELDAHRLPVIDLAFSPDGTWLASAGADGLLALWRTVSWSLGVIASAQTAPDELLTVAFHPTLPMLATGGSDGRLRFWSMNGMPLHDEALGAPVAGIAFAPAGDRMAIALGGPEARVLLMRMR